MNLLGTAYGSDEDSGAEDLIPNGSASAHMTSSAPAPRLIVSTTKVKKPKRKKTKLALSILPPEIQAALARGPPTVSRDSDDDDDLDAELDQEDRERRKKLRLQVAESKAVQGRTKAGAKGLSALLPKPQAQGSTFVPKAAAQPQVSSLSGVSTGTDTMPNPSAAVQHQQGLDDENEHKEEESQDESDQEDEGQTANLHPSLLAIARATALPRTSMFGMGGLKVASAPVRQNDGDGEHAEQMLAPGIDSRQWPDPGHYVSQTEVQEPQYVSQSLADTQLHEISTGQNGSQCEAYALHLASQGYTPEQIQAACLHASEGTAAYGHGHTCPEHVAYAEVEDDGEGLRGKDRRTAKRLRAELAAGNLNAVDALSGGQTTEVSGLQEKWDPFRHGLPKRSEKARIAASFYDTKSGETRTVMDVSQTHKRKHHINALAIQAAEREADLLESRGRAMLTKAQTQGKYGW